MKKLTLIVVMCLMTLSVGGCFEKSAAGYADKKLVAANAEKYKQLSDELKKHGLDIVNFDTDKDGWIDGTEASKIGAAIGQAEAMKIVTDALATGDIKCAVDAAKSRNSELLMQLLALLIMTYGHRAARKYITKKDKKSA